MLEERDLIVFAECILESELSDYPDILIETSLSESESENYLGLKGNLLS